MNRTNYKLAKFLLIVFLLPGLAGAQQKLGLSYFLKDFYDFSALPTYLPKTFAAQESSYDRSGGNDDGFRGTYSFLRKNADSSLVLLDIKGAGLINRIWTPTPTDDSIEFYIDDSVRPSFALRYSDLFSGKIFPFVAPLCSNQLGGFYCYLPIPFSSSCKIVLRATQTKFHQIGYRLYPPGTAVRPFSLPLSVEERQVLAGISVLWGKKNASVNDFSGARSLVTSRIITLQPLQTALVYETKQGGRISGFELESATDLGETAKNIDIRVWYDGEQTPAIYCPLADYFGFAFGKAAMQGLLVGSDGKKFYSRFPMPFDKSAKIELIYRAAPAGSETSGVSLLCRLYTTEKKRDAKQEGRFYARWNRENPVQTGKPYTIAELSGKGHFVGLALQAQSLVAGITGNFEGDDSTVVDGQLRMHGTGSEDFFNGGWYALLDRWDAAMSLPLSGALEYSVPLGRTGGYRYFVSDKISFEQSFLQTIEHGPEHSLWPSDYRSVSYFYCDKNNLQKILPNAGNTHIYEPDTLEIYPQLMPWTTDESSTVQSLWAFSAAKTMYYTIRENSLLRMSLKDIPDGKYQINLDYLKSPDAAIFSIWQRQTPITDWIDPYLNKTVRVPMQEVGHVEIDKWKNAFSFHFKTPGGRNKFALTRVILVKEK